MLLTNSGLFLVLSRRRLLLALSIVLGMVWFRSDAQASITLQLPTLGAPHGTMHSLPPPQGITVPGWTATTLRLVSDSGNITGVNFTGVNPQGFPRGVYGSFAQIWVSPGSNAQYTQTTPGFRTENNSFASEFNLDSHFLGEPANYTIISPLEEGNVEIPSFNPIPSDGTYGYGNAIPFDLVHRLDLTGYLRGAFTIAPSQQRSFLDLAYVALGGGGELIGEVITTAGTIQFATSFSSGIPFPEPSPAILIDGLAFMQILIRRRR